MIITDSFVFLNYPKTGSTFVREVMNELYSGYKNSWRHRFFKRKLFDMNVMLQPELRLKQISERFEVPTEHGTASQIPLKYRNLNVYSIYRDPAERLISNYYYADWKNKDVWLAEEREIKERFPDFPELSFKDFILYFDTFWGLEIEVGGQKFTLSWLASDFLKFFSRRMINADRVNVFSDWREFDENLKSVSFLKQNKLTSDLYDLLCKHGHSKSRLKFILEKQRVNVSPDSAQTQKNLETAGEIIEKDLFFYALVQRIVRHEKVDYTRLKSFSRQD